MSRPEDEVAPETYKAVNDAYYAQLVASPTAVRTRAQNAYAVAAAIATALVTAGVLTNFEDQDAAVQALGWLSVCGWIATALIFMWAIGGSVSPVKSGDAEGDSAFVDAVVANVHNETTAISSTIAKAWICGLVASGLTVATLGASLLRDEPSKGSKSARLALSMDGQTNLKALCGSAKPAILGTLDLDSLDTERIALTVPAVRCPTAPEDGDRVTLQFPKKQVIGVLVLAK
jgi:hypothetical protein